MKNFCIYKITIFHRYLYVTRIHNAKKHNNRNMLDKKIFVAFYISKPH